MSDYYEPEHNVTFQQKIQRSAFIADLAVCHDVHEAKNFLAQIIAQHRNATHHSRAYLFSSGTDYSSDDGEPSGSAGKPILNAIKHSQLQNVMVIVTRYFGGVKLGIRGLINAYNSTATQALSMCGKIHRTPARHISITMSYGNINHITKLLEAAHAHNISWAYAQAVMVTASIPVNTYDVLARQLSQYTVTLL